MNGPVLRVHEYSGGGSIIAMNYNEPVTESDSLYAAPAAAAR